MVKKMSLSIWLLLALFINNGICQSDLIQAKLTIKKAHSGKMLTIDADVYYSILERRMVSVYINPEHFITFTNEKGEMKVYYPAKNQVYQDQNEFYSASTDVFYFFFTQG